MMNINISIRRKKASSPASHIVCGNTDYQITFTFDSEWDAYDVKTARFIWNGQYVDVVFTGNVCPVPTIRDATLCMVGVYAGDLHTTTPAYIKCDRSILCGEGSPAAPTEDVYAQIMKLLNNGGPGGGGGGVTSWNDLEDKPFDSVREWVEELPRSTFTNVRKSGNVYEVSIKNENFHCCDGFVDGDTYVVEWDGEEYECVAYASGSIVHIGGTGWPFRIWHTSSMAYCSFADERDSVTIAVRHFADNVTKIDPKYIPTISWDSLSDKPFGEDENGRVVQIDPKYVNIPPVFWDEVLRKPFGDNDDGTVTKIDPKYLPDNIGGGGGASSWHELTGKPFYAQAGDPVLGETALPIADGQTALPDVVPLTPGELYVVRWNGVEYACEAIAMEMEGLNIITLGDFAAMAGEGYSTGEPFILIFLDSDGAEAMGMGIMGAVYDGSETVVLSIHKPVVHPIHQDYIVLTSPNGTKYRLSVSDSGALSATEVTV